MFFVTKMIVLIGLFSVILISPRLAVAAELLLKAEEYQLPGARGSGSHYNYRNGPTTLPMGSEKWSTQQIVGQRRRLENTWLKLNNPRVKVLLQTRAAVKVYRVDEIDNKIKILKQELGATKSALKLSIKQNSTLIKALRAALTKTIDDIPNIVALDPKILTVLKNQLEDGERLAKKK